MINKSPAPWLESNDNEEDIPIVTAVPLVYADSSSSRNNATATANGNATSSNVVVIPPDQVENVAVEQSAIADPWDYNGEGRLPPAPPVDVDATRRERRAKKHQLKKELKTFKRKIKQEIKETSG